MRHNVLFLWLLLGSAFWGITCAGSADEKNNAQPGPADYTLAADTFLVDKLPVNTDTLTTGFRDVHYYTSDDHFCIVGIVDNQSPFWQKIWLKAQLIDSTGNALAIQGDTALIIRAFSDAVPPRGATAFFAAVPLSRIAGMPAQCRVTGAGAIQQPGGPILIATVFNSTNVRFPDSTDASGSVAKLVQVQATLENPLNVQAYHPRLLVLLYGKDQRLYYARLVNPELPDAPVTQNNQGPMAPAEKRNVTCQIVYDLMPEPLRNQLVYRVEMQAFDAR
ncbi:MAG: hypothetical protein R3D58_22555 [Saprospiraceae bacterium]|nr:hypothetical protein [Lewinellaceae bacterium]